MKRGSLFYSSNHRPLTYMGINREGISGGERERKKERERERERERKKERKRAKIRE